MTYYKEIVSRTLLSLPIWKIRLYIKRCLCRLCIRKVSYCYRCGIDVRDFSVSDEEWSKIFEDMSGIICYNCYKDIEFLHKYNCKKYVLISPKKKRENK